MINLSQPRKTIYLIRHGQTEFNRMKLVQGSGVDSNLNDLGRQQANCFFEAYKHLPFDKIYTSALRRTHQTVENFINMGLPWTQLTGLNEMSWGDREGREITAEEDEAYFDMIEGWRRGELHRKTPGGESPLEVKARQEKALAHILASPEEENILVCMHGRAMRLLLCLMLEQPLSQMDNFEHQNVCLYILRYENEKFSIIKRNCIKHLDGIDKHQEHITQ
ncbi:MAG: histidine phosphatase family protein [Bernardetiaceae bacterium]|nr:histidine phosphatase family protein [Bernardetiaceae bacterium]